MAHVSELSPYAREFVPMRLGYTEFAPFDAVYNDGIPQGVLIGNHADHDVIHNISDDAIDQIFPPDASDAAELDALDDWLQTMINLSLLEEREELARRFLFVKKRFEARRKLGLKGKPKPVAGLVKRIDHGETVIPDEMRIVHYGHHHRRKTQFLDIEEKRRNFGPSRNKPVSKHSKIYYHTHPMPLVQPRKQN